METWQGVISIIGGVVAVVSALGMYLSRKFRSEVADIVEDKLEPVTREQTRLRHDINNVIQVVVNALDLKAGDQWRLLRRRDDEDRDRRE